MSSINNNISNMLTRRDFQLFTLHNSQYVFLTGNSQILEITSPLMDTYFKMCTGQDIKTPLDYSTVNLLTNTLRNMQIANTTKQNTEKQAMLILNTTHGCNMACKYCFASTYQDRQNVMSLSVVRRAIIYMLENNPDAKQYIIYFFGGEPLLHKQFIEDAVKIAKELVVGRHKKCVNFLLNTNGTLIDEAMLRFFKKEDFTITISIDGPKYANDANRIFLNGRGSFNRIMEGIEKLKAHAIKFNLRATFNPRASHLVETFRFFEELEISYSYAFAIDSKEKDKSETHFTDEDIVRFDGELKAVMQYLSDKVIQGKPVYCSDFRNKISRLKERSIKLHGCEAGRSSLMVDESGDYYTCQNMLPYKETAVGSLSKGINADKLKRYQSSVIENLPVCQECWARYLCGGGCEAERHTQQQNDGGFTQKCKLTQVEWKHFVATYIKLNQVINNNINNKKQLNYEEFKRIGA